MARYLFQLTAVTPAGSYVRLDSASGSTSPTAVSPIDSAYVFPGAILHSDATDGSLPRVAAGVSTLYQKTLSSTGSVTATATLTGTAIEGADLGSLPPMTFPTPVNTDPNGLSASAATLATNSAFTAAYAVSGVPSHAGARVKRYDPNSNGYNWKASNTRRLRASLGKAQAGTAPAHHAFVGDSETDAYTGTTEQLKMWPIWYRTVLSSLGVPVGGDGFVRASSLAPARDPRWAYTGTWTTNLQWSSTTTNGATATFTTDQAGTKIDVAYFGNSGAFTVAIDGGSAVTVTPADGSPIVRKYSVTGLANTTHTVVITTTTTTTTYVIGACCYSASGLLVHNIAMYGSKTSDYTASTTTSGYREIYRQALPATPDVVWVALGVNDIRNSVAVATANANLQTLIAAYPSSDIILVGQYATSDAAMSNWPAWISSLYDLADSLDVPLLDLYDRSGGYTTANGNGLMGDTIHPNGAAQRDWGRTAALLAAR